MVTLSKRLRLEASTIGQCTTLYTRASPHASRTRRRAAFQLQRFTPALPPPPITVWQVLPPEQSAFDVHSSTSDPVQEALQVELELVKLSVAQHFCPDIQLSGLEQANLPPVHAAPSAMHVEPPNDAQHTCVAGLHDAVPHLIVAAGASLAASTVASAVPVSVPGVASGVPSDAVDESGADASPASEPDVSPLVSDASVSSSEASSSKIVTASPPPQPSAMDTTRREARLIMSGVLQAARSTSNKSRSTRSVRAYAQVQ